MDVIAKTFDELTTLELYEILKARAAVFVKEQGISYVDEDNTDFISLHCFYMEDGLVKGYLRAYPEEKSTDAVCIGRVLTMERGKGLGTELMKKSIEIICERMQCSKICMDAQKHAVPFYERLGFKVTSDEYLEEGIIHVDMEMNVADRSH